MSHKDSFRGRKIVNIYETPYQEYDLEGPLQDDISYIALSYERDGDRLGTYVMRMEPGAETIAHTHTKMEDFLIVEGEVKAGDLVHYEPGTHHNTRTETGCLLVGFDWLRKS